MEKQIRKVYADMETYGLKYMAKNLNMEIKDDYTQDELKYIIENGKTKGYAHLAIEPIDNINIFDVNTEIFLNQLKDLALTNNDLKYVVYFHNGGGFDFHFLIHTLNNMDKFGKTKVLMEDNKRILQFSWSTEKDGRYDTKDGKKGKRIKTTIYFRDTFRKWPLSLKKLGKVVGLEKLDYGDYNIARDFTNEEYMYNNTLNDKDGVTEDYKYLLRDVNILIEVDKIVGQHFAKNKLTIGSEAIATLKDKSFVVKFLCFGHINEQEWREIKKGYRGGFTWVNPVYQLKMLNNISVYDVNSLYPSVMLYNKFPYGYPNYEKKGTFHIYDINIKYAKAKTVPFIDYTDENAQILEAAEETTVYETEYKYPKELRNYTRRMSNYMYEFFKENYEGEWEVKYIMSFEERYGHFEEYVNIFKELKETSTGAIREIAKLLINTPYGKMGEEIKKNSGIFMTEEELSNYELKYNKDGKPYAYFNENGILFFIRKAGNLYYTIEEGETKRQDDFSPIQIGLKITELSRIVLLKAVIANWGRVAYTDTDSIHIVGDAVGIDIDESEFGKWKFEGKWDKAVYRRPKHYYHLNNNGDYELKGGGLLVSNFSPDNLPLEQYLKPNFAVPNGKRKKAFVDGGILLYDGNYNFSMPKWWKGEQNV